MSSAHFNPWAPDDFEGNLASEFRQHAENLKKAVDAGSFCLSQYGSASKSGRPDFDKFMGPLMWRHYIIFSLSRLFSRVISSSNQPRDKSLTFVELGTCDGVSAYFALNGALDGTKEVANAVLVDSWQSMRVEDFGVLDKVMTGNYSYLNVETARSNLRKFARCEFLQGYVPEILADERIPKKIDLLHIDLNSSIPTREALKTLVPRLSRPGAVLFDDYGWKSFRGTKLEVDKFLKEIHSGDLICLPTGQSIWIQI